MYLVVRSLKHNNTKVDYEIQQGDILKIGRVKFAVKEIGYSELTLAQRKEAEGVEKGADQEEVKQETGHSANSIYTDSKDEEFEEFTEVPAILN